MANSKRLEQGEGGARKGKSGSHLDDKGEGGARKGRSGNHLDQNPNNKRARKSSGDQYTQPRAWTAGRKTAERGGHSRTGHDHVNPTRAKSKSGSHLVPHNL